MSKTMPDAVRSVPFLRRSLAAGMSALVLLGLTGAACTGRLGETSPAGGDAAPGGGSAPGGGASSSGGGPVDCSVASTSPSVLRRLSRLEYQLTLQDLFQLDAPPAVDGIPEDTGQGGFRTISALQNVSDQHLRAYLATAETLGQELMADEARRAEVLGCEPGAAGCLEGFAHRFGKLAYRRPLAAEEVDDLIGRAEEVAQDDLDAFRFVIEALLTSPSFLFRIEVGAGGAETSPLTPLELASRLSFTLWGRAPGAELLARAEAGELDAPEGLDAVAKEMVDDERTEIFFNAFFKQWLSFEALRAPVDPGAGWTPALLDDMITESERVLGEHAFTPGADFLDALTANHTYVTPALGAFYGLEVSGDGVTRVEFPADHHRANTGLLTHASLISAKNDGDLLAVRGQWLRAAFLCQDIEFPAGLIDQLASELSGLTYPQVIQKRNTEAACSGCHALIDPLGVGFAQYDKDGRYDGSIRIDEFGLEPRFAGAANESFESLADLAAELRRSPDLAACVAKKLFIYTQGREPAAEDLCAIDAAAEAFALEGNRFRAYLTAIVQSPSFRLRRAPE
ncbi:DUF1592 domain-containing protein [Sorangium sp. So ce1036]|uniref:DUF1592 domain-containing protein n=1 Tax=Sorangium sp. So ce1036 TaxID=3133328 RepID=UPI003F0C436E